MKFWDASAIVPLLLDEKGRNRLLAILEHDPVMLAWWSTPVECVSAIARRERDGDIRLRDVTTALERLRALGESWQEVLPTEAVRTTAQRLLRVHALRAADSMQLAAAVVAAEYETAALPFVSLDERLNEAATREGFPVVGLE
jgi:predicted nucleic acid-binding protein